MPTYVQHHLEEIDNWRHQLEEFSHSGFELTELKALISTIGLKMEQFLRAAVLPSTSPQVDLAGVINRLGQVGVSKSARKQLHKVRVMYNDVKHDPAFQPSLSETIECVREVKAIVNSLEANVGRTHAEMPRSFRRVQWLAAWDHYIGGDTEVHVLFPSQDPFVPSMDSVNIRMAAWDQVKEELRTLGRVRAGTDVIPADVYEAFRSEDEFHDAIAFEGEYRDVIGTLAKYELRVDGLIEPMDREKTTQSMLQAFALALLDVAGFPDCQNYPAAIFGQVINLYAVAPNWSEIHPWCVEFGALVEQLSASQRSGLSGPIWLSQDRFVKEEARAIARHNRLPLLIDQRLIVCLGL